MKPSITKYEETCQHCAATFFTIPSKKRRFCGQKCSQEHQRPTEQLFWDKVAKASENECWMWQAGLGTNGYGDFKSRGLRYSTANQFAYYFTYGEIPLGMVICHTCDTPGCVNPKHLFMGTKADNAKDMAAKGRSYWQKKTHCPSGHKYTPENTVTATRSSGATFRMCLECKREHGRKTSAKRRAKLKQ